MYLLLALSGNIFQNVFRNPMAAPTMLGVNTGVNIASMIPMYLLRFSFNVVSNTPDETRGLGIDSNLFRFVTLIIGTFMMTAAMVHCGAIGMVSLAVPFVGRSLFGQDFRKQFWANLLLGALFLLVC